MLEGLNDVAWGRLQHAYGPADDVPALLRALANPAAGPYFDRDDDPIYALHGNIWHQGTVYEASSYAVPFLVELALDPSIRRRDEILGLLGSLADGKSFLDVHGQMGGRVGDSLRNKPDFDSNLKTELQNVRRTRLAVFDYCPAIGSLLHDAIPMVRAGAAYVLSRFPDHAATLGPLVRKVAASETDPLARAGQLWCLGSVRDSSPETTSLLIDSLRDNDPIQRCAATIALYLITGSQHPAAVPTCRCMVAATWFAESFLAGVPWDFTSEVRLNDIFQSVSPDPTGATQMLLSLLPRADVNTGIVHDLLALNFPNGNWRKTTRLSDVQAEVLRRLTTIDAAWKDFTRLWFLLPDPAKNLASITVDDVQNVRNEMRAVLGRP